MYGYNKPEITREDMAEAENVFLSMTSDGELYSRQLPRYAKLLGCTVSSSARDARHYLEFLVHGYANHLERGEMCNGPISYIARAVAAGWLESYYRDHIAEGGLAA